MDDFLSLIVGPLKFNEEAQKFAFEMVLKLKGLELETSMAQNEIILAEEHPKFADKVQELRLLRDQHVQLIVAGPSDQKPLEYQKSLKKMFKRIETLESVLARDIPEMNLKKRLEKVDINVITPNIPFRGFLIDFVRFDYFLQGNFIGPRYLAFVIGSRDSDDFYMVDLGDADSIDKRIMDLRQKITGEENIWELSNDKIDQKSSEVSNTLKDLILDPILDIVNIDCDTLFISPDGNLSLLPLEIIPYQDGFLTDYYEISYLGTSRDLLRFDQELGKCSRPVIIVDPDFNYNKHGPTDNSSNFSLIRGFKRGEIEFKPLPATRVEGEIISKILYSHDVLLWMGEEAVETRLKTLRSPWILHLATHGFFLPELNPTSSDPKGTGGLHFTGPNMENPLIRSGLAFAGANTYHDDLPEDAEDGIFTAEEASGLNLLNTELVVLSACETGLGEVRRGEGVFGLRRAFVLAGARTLVMSLWKVDDLATTILMERFYQNLIEKNMGKNIALKEAQRYLRDLKIRELRKSWLKEETIENIPETLQKTLRRLSKRSDENQPFKHPRFWGAFICQGDPSSLRRSEIN